MHIVINTLTLKRCGAERVITNLCNEYFINKYKVTIITCAYGRSSYKLNNSIDHICIDKKQEQLHQNKIIRFIRRRKKLKNILKKLKPDVILSFLPEPNFLVLSLKSKLKAPVIISVRNDPVMEYSFLPYKILMEVLYPKSYGFVFQTEKARDYFKFIKEKNKSSQIIANPINKEFIQNRYTGKRQKTIVSAGRLEGQKNFKLLIAAFSKIAKKYPGYNLIIYGEGVLRQELEKLTDRLELSDRISLPGKVNNIKEKIYKASLFVLTSDYEGMPNALMEAMALGLPVISTDCPCGGPKFLIKDNYNGLLVPVGDIKSLSEAIEKVIKDKLLADNLGKHASNISEDLNPDKIYQKWDEYIKSVVNQDNKL